MLVDEYKSAGKYEVEFNAAPESIPAITSGVYFYKLNTGDTFEKKMILLR